jgi:hypothetical protein
MGFQSASKDSCGTVIGPLSGRRRYIVSLQAGFSGSFAREGPEPIMLPRLVAILARERPKL